MPLCGNTNAIRGFLARGKGKYLYITHDGGEHWKKVTEDDGFPKGELGRIGVAISRSHPDVIYALVESKKMPCIKVRMVGSHGKK